MAKRWTADQMPSLAGRLAVVTGANSGLGLETSIALAAAGAEVIMACRSPSKADTALTELRTRVPNAKVTAMRLDLADLASIRSFADEFKSEHRQLDLLINNAGVMALPLSRTADGFEMQIGTNHLGHFALTGLLLGALQAASASRIVNLASLAHRWTLGMDLGDLNFQQRRYNKWDAYGKSKLANLLFTFELARRLPDSKLIVAAAHPGYASTNLQFVGPQMENSRVGQSLMVLGNVMLGQSAAMGALPTLYAATARDVINGDYFGPGGFQQLHGHPRKVGCRAAARDEKQAAALWSISQELTGVSYL